MPKKLRELLKRTPEIEKVQILSLLPGDVVVLSTPGAISKTTANLIKEYWERHFDGIKCAVLADGLEVHKVLRPEEQAKR
jgi:hypothetical protein